MKKGQIIKIPNRDWEMEIIEINDYKISVEFKLSHYTKLNDKDKKEIEEGIIDFGKWKSYKELIKDLRV